MKCTHCDMTFTNEAARDLHMKVLHPDIKVVKSIPIGRKFERIVAKIEKCFYAYQKQDVHHLSFAQIKDWINSNSANGLSSPRLANFLRRRPQFKMVRKFRKIGTNVTESYWSLSDNDIISDVGAASGWIEVDIDE